MSKRTNAKTIILSSVAVCKKCDRNIYKMPDLVFLTSEVNTPLTESVPYERFCICKDCYQDLYRWMGANNNA